MKRASLAVLAIALAGASLGAGAADGAPLPGEIITRIGQVAAIPADAEAVIAVGIEGLKIAVTEMPGIPTFGYIGFVAWDQQYWTNWPGSENPYTQPYTHWGPFKYMTPFLEPTGR